MQCYQGASLQLVLKFNEMGHQLTQRLPLIAPQIKQHSEKNTYSLAPYHQLHRHVVVEIKD